MSPSLNKEYCIVFYCIFDGKQLVISPSLCFLKWRKQEIWVCPMTSHLASFLLKFGFVFFDILFFFILLLFLFEKVNATHCLLSCLVNCSLTYIFSPGSLYEPTRPYHPTPQWVRQLRHYTIIVSFVRTTISLNNDIPIVRQAFFAQRYFWLVTTQRKYFQLHWI